MSALIMADWYPSSKTGYYRKFEVNYMSWENEIDLESFILTCAFNGGPIAVMRDRSKLLKIQGSAKPVISIYSASGRLISNLVWNSGNILQLGWSNEEELLCAQEDGTVLVYDMFANFVRSFSMGRDVQSTGAYSAKIFESAIGTGVAVLTNASRIFLINNYKDPKTRLLGEMPGLQLNLCEWAVFGMNRHTSVLLAFGPGLYSVNEVETKATLKSVDLGEKGSVVIKIVPSASQRSVALLTNHSRLWMGSSDLQTTYKLADVKHLKIKQIVWCGDEGVVLSCDGSLEMLNRNENSLSFLQVGSCQLMQDRDCVRVFNPSSLEIIQRVPQVVVDIFRINSTSPGSYLLEASVQYEKKSHRANEYINLVKPELGIAVQQCINAAGNEFDPNVQKMLLKGAKFGMCFLADHNPELYVDTCRLLRVLNSIRSSNIGIALTYAELQHIGIRMLIDMLVRRRHYYLAIQTVKYLHIADLSSYILTHWALYKVRQLKSDYEQVAEDIAEKFGQNAGVSYVDIAKEAIKNGRTELAVKLLDYEPRAPLVVPMLLSLGKVEKALEKAIDSGNTDLVYSVIIHIHENMQLSDFEMKIRKYPLAQQLYIKYCKDHNRERLRTIYIQEDNHGAQAACFLEDAYNSKNSTTRIASLVGAAEKWKIDKNDLYSTLCNEQIKLLKCQSTLEEKCHREFVGGSLQDTIMVLLNIGEVKLADKMCAEYNMPERRYWWLRIKSLSDQKKWADLETFSKSRKSPIGYEPFIDVCLEHNMQSEALKYMPKVKEESRAKYMNRIHKSFPSTTNLF